MNLAKSNKKEDVNAEAQSEMFATLAETLLPKIKPFILPATKKVRDWINSGNSIFIQTFNGEPYAFIIKNEDIDSFHLKDGKEPEQTYSLEEIVEKIISGNFNN